eukprot:CAMPEP_0174720708 /NCGR_PEP_ID=MMETSP1094-20130205/34267_1 /TAXON_ID=156173 /ORGANISM="Chrysochromulina brevifilum, Strain UTEX LB 985" /LENGTH=66 /DNA_ID=CAMNT_0015921237 /DNA_START=227 /DNA_END=427 /DNA_ORIENTATION=-
MSSRRPRLLYDFQQLNVELDVRVRRHEARESSRTVRQLRRNGHACTRTSAQLHQALVKSRDHLTDA